MFLYGELSVVISAMAVWMDLKDASVDNGWILFSFMIGFLIQITENGPKGGVIFLAGVAVPVLLLGNPFYIPYDRRRRYQASVRTWRDHGAADSYGMYCLFSACRCRHFSGNSYFYRRYPPTIPLFISVYE